MGKSIKNLRMIEEKRLKFVILNMRTYRIKLIMDSSFENSSGMKSPLNFIILLADGN